MNNIIFVLLIVIGFTIGHLFIGPCLFPDVHVAFKKGDCIQYSFEKDEFGENGLVVTFLVNKINKTHYQLFIYDTPPTLSRGSAHRIHYIDEHSIKIECPKFVKEYYEKNK